MPINLHDDNSSNTNEEENISKRDSWKSERRTILTNHSFSDFQHGGIPSFDNDKLLFQGNDEPVISPVDAILIAESYFTYQPLTMQPPTVFDSLNSTLLTMAPTLPPLPSDVSDSSSLNLQGDSCTFTESELAQEVSPTSMHEDGTIHSSKYELKLDNDSLTPEFSPHSSFIKDQVNAHELPPMITDDINFYFSSEPNTNTKLDCSNPTEVFIEHPFNLTVATYNGEKAGAVSRMSGIFTSHCYLCTPTDEEYVPKLAQRYQLTIPVDRVVIVQYPKAGDDNSTLEQKNAVIMQNTRIKAGYGPYDNSLELEIDSKDELVPLYQLPKKEQLSEESAIAALSIISKLNGQINSRLMLAWYGSLHDTGSFRDTLTSYQKYNAMPDKKRCLIDDPYFMLYRWMGRDNHTSIGHLTIDRHDGSGPIIPESLDPNRKWTLIEEETIEAESPRP